MTEHAKAHEDQVDHQLHDHHDEPSSELRHDVPLREGFVPSNDPNDPLNFTRKHPLFDL